MASAGSPLRLQPTVPGYYAPNSGPKFREACHFKSNLMLQHGVTRRWGSGPFIWPGYRSATTGYSTLLRRHLLLLLRASLTVAGTACAYLRPKHLSGTPPMTNTPTFLSVRQMGLGFTYTTAFSSRRHPCSETCSPRKGPRIWNTVSRVYSSKRTRTRLNACSASATPSSIRRSSLLMLSAPS